MKVPSRRFAALSSRVALGAIVFRTFRQSTLEENENACDQERKATRTRSSWPEATSRYTTLSNPLDAEAARALGPGRFAFASPF